jgi:hypothetical protein
VAPPAALSPDLGTPLGAKWEVLKEGPLSLNKTAQNFKRKKSRPQEAGGMVSICLQKCGPNDPAPYGAAWVTYGAGGGDTLD